MLKILRNKLIGTLGLLCISGLMVGATQAAETVDIAALNQTVQQACPVVWEDLKVEIDPAAYSDPWQGSSTDRDTFVAYLTTAMGSSAPDEAGLDALAGDVEVVVAECAHHRIQLTHGLLKTVSN